MAFQPETALAEKSEALTLKQVRSLLDHAPVAIWYSRDGMVIFANQQICRMLGATDASQIEQHSSIGFVHPDKRNAALDARRLATDQGVANAAFTMVRLDGTFVDVEATAWIVDLADGPAYQVMLSDVTESKRTRLELQKSERRFRSTFEQTSVGIAHLSLDGSWLAVNERLCEIVGYSREELIRMNFRDITHPDDMGMRILQPYQDVLSGRVRSYQLEKRYIRKDGAVIWVYITGSLARDEQGQPLYEICVIEDITSRKRTEAELADRNARLRAALEASSTGTFHWNIRTNELDWDDNLDRLFGLTPGSKVRSLDQFVECVHPEDRAGVIERCRRCAAEGADFEMEFRVIWPDGSIHWLYDRGKTARDLEGVPSWMTGACVDISNAKQTEEALRSTEKLAAVGRMAASISHEINNPLEAVTNLLYLADTSVSPDASREYVQQAQQELSRVAHVVTQTLRFYRPVRTSGVCDVAQVVESVITLYRGRIQNSGATIKVDIDRRQARCNEGELRQVIGNLVGNALDAIPLGGRLRIHSSPAVCRADQRTGTHISVADSGCGIAPENLSRVFEAFFTTKEHTGTGLGLWVSREIIEKRRGTIRVRSALGKGTVVSIFLPD